MTGSTNQRYEAFSTEWVDALREYVLSRITADDLVGSGTASMELRNPPKHLLRYGLETVGWSAQLQDGKLEIFDRPNPEADLRSVSEYEGTPAQLKLNNEEDRKYVEALIAKQTGPGGIPPLAVRNANPLRSIFVKVDLREGFYNVYTA